MARLPTQELLAVPLSELTARVVTETVEQDYDVMDKKQRRVGGRVTLATETYEPTTRPGSGYHMQVGTWFSATPQPTRNGQAYGPCQQTLTFATQAERAAWVGSYFSKAAKRNRKQFAVKEAAR